MRPQGSFVPPSLSAFSWPSQVFDVVPSSTLLQPANVSMTQFLRTRAISIRPDAKPTPQLHLSSTPLTAMLSTPNFVTIMDFVNGNLNDLLHPPGDVPKPGQGGVAIPKQVQYNPNLKFGPDPRASINFRFTLAIPSIAAVFLANPNEWMKAKPVYSYANAANSHLLQPFFHASVSNLLMDLGTLEGGNTHINFCATSLDLLDLRMGQRLAHISSKVSQDDEEEVVPLDEGHTQWVHDRGLDNSNSNENENDTPQPSSSRQTFGQEARDGDVGQLSNMSPLRVSDAATTLSTPATPAFAFLNEPGFTVDSSRAASGGSYTPGNPEWYSNGSHPQQRMARNITVDSTAAEPPHTGIRLSVARRLSEHSHRRAASGEDMQQFNSPLDSSGPGSHGAPTPGRNAGGVPRKYLPVLDFVDLPEVSNQCLEPGEQHEGPVVGRDMATFRILTAPHHPPLEEVPRGGAKSTTSGVKSYPGSNPNVRVEVSVAVLSDGTTAVEIALSSALIQWPYFHDASLIMSLINLFKVPSIEEREENGDDYPVPQQEQQQSEKQQQGTKAVPPGGMATSLGSLAASDSGPSSWLYVNALLVDTEIFVPIIDVPMAQRLIDELWEREEVNGVDASMEGNTREQPPAPDHPAKAKKSKRIPTKSHFQKVADLALATMLLDSTDNPGALALEERGLAVGITIGRVAYAAGGDGESVLKVDVKDMAAFIRDPNALVRCILQPFSCSMELMSQVPEAAEHLEVERMHRAATIIQRQWRRLMARKLLRDHKAQAEAALAFQGLRKSPFKNKKGKQGAHAGPEFEDVNRSRHWLLVDELVMDVASPHTRTLLEDYKKTSRDRMQLMYLSQYRAVSGMTIRIEAGELTMRAAFSHVSFWQTAIQGVEEVVVSALQADGVLPAPQHTEDGGASASASASSSTSSLALRNHGLASSASASAPSLGFGSSSIAAKAAAAAFRPHSFHVSGALENLALVLCNDKPETFGAPDVLQFSVCKATASYDAATILPDRPANKAGRLELSTHASFLNSGTSKWEPLFDLWPVMAEFVDINSPIFISDRKT
jgi:hypothetical protein